MAAPPAAVHRCPWAEADPSVADYHDTEWGVPVVDERGLYRALVLEGAQAGLSWRTVWRRHDAYRRAFCDFDPEAVARFDDAEVARIVADGEVIAHRGKVESAVANARATLALRRDGTGLAELLWGAVGGRPRANTWRVAAEVPARTPASEAMSRDLRRRGFRFVGPTICYALMQATGMVNDHLVGCWRWAAVGAEGRRVWSAS